MGTISPIYLQQDDSRLLGLVETPYEAEEVLQDLLAHEPKLLAGDSDSSGVRWLLIEQEKGVAAEEGGGSQWYLDHLFIDSEGTLTLVEVKRASDTRARREVVAQMLDYAANAAKGWDVEGLQAALSERCTEQGVDPSKAMQDFLADDLSEEDFWERVADKLNSHSYRLVFVADEISPQLQSIVEYMNEQMSQTEVLALEVKQYLEEEGNRRMVVPRLIGQTSTANQKKAKSSGKRGTPWSKEDVYAEIREHFSSTPKLAERTIALAEQLISAGAEVTGGSGTSWSSIKLTLWGNHEGGDPFPVVIEFTYIGPAINFAQMRGAAPRATLKALTDELSQIAELQPMMAEAEQREWNFRRTLPPEIALADDESARRLETAILHAAREVDRG